MTCTQYDVEFGVHTKKLLEHPAEQNIFIVHTSLILIKHNKVNNIIRSLKIKKKTFLIWRMINYFFAFGKLRFNVFMQNNIWLFYIYLLFTLAKLYSKEISKGFWNFGKSLCLILDICTYVITWHIINSNELYNHWRKKIENKIC